VCQGERKGQIKRGNREKDRDKLTEEESNEVSAREAETGGMGKGQTHDGHRRRGRSGNGRQSALIKMICTSHISFIYTTHIHTLCILHTVYI